MVPICVACSGSGLRVSRGESRCCLVLLGPAWAGAVACGEWRPAPYQGQGASRARGYTRLLQAPCPKETGMLRHCFSKGSLGELQEKALAGTHVTVASPWVGTGY